MQTGALVRSPRHLNDYNLHVMQLPLGEAWHPCVRIDGSVPGKEIPQSGLFHSVVCILISVTKLLNCFSQKSCHFYIPA